VQVTWVAEAWIRSGWPSQRRPLKPPVPPKRVLQVVLSSDLEASESTVEAPAPVMTQTPFAIGGGVNESDSGGPKQVRRRSCHKTNMRAMMRLGARLEQSVSTMKKEQKAFMEGLSSQQRGSSQSRKERAPEDMSPELMSMSAEPKELWNLEDGPEKDELSSSEEEVVLAEGRRRGSSMPPITRSRSGTALPDDGSEVSQMLKYLLLKEIERAKKEAENGESEDGDDFVGLGAEKTFELSGVSLMRKR
jgi:hypothetical protein